jgi:hypothetical protein
MMSTRRLSRLRNLLEVGLIAVLVVIIFLAIPYGA